MSAFDDLAAAISRLNTSTSAELKAISDKIAALSAGTVTDAQLSDLAAQVNAVSDKLDTETATLAAPSVPVGTPPATGG